MPTPLSDPDLISQVLASLHLNQRTLAAILDVHESAVSRWRRDLQQMTPGHRAVLVYLSTHLEGVSR